MPKIERIITYVGKTEQKQDQLLECALDLMYMGALHLGQPPSRYENRPIPVDELEIRHAEIIKDIYWTVFPEES
tara:strand:+ start:289 stop:510 length:222 start_codon:yes stop_codon:yes gene_type:complete